MNEIEKGRETNQAALELLYNVGREVAAAPDLQTVLERVLQLSMNNVGAISGSIIVIDEQGEPAEMAFSMLGHPHDQAALQLRSTYERGLAGWVARQREAVLIQDTSRDPRWLRRPDDAADKTGPKSAVSAPILARERLAGVITLVHPHPGFFMPAHLDLVKAIADQAGTAIRNAHLYESLQAAHRRYRELFQDSIDSILITERDGRIIEVNHQAEKILGIAPEELLGQNICDLHAADLEEFGSNFLRLGKGEMVDYESVLNSAGGRKIPIQVYARKIQIGADSNLQWILRDISERKDLDRIREDLVAMVYHDLRSPLANIVSSLDVLSSMFLMEEDEAVQNLLSIALRSTERIQRLTNSLLNISQLEVGQVIGNRQPTNVSALISDAIDAVLQAAKNKDQQVTWEFEPDLPPIFADGDMIRRILINLLENAVKFTPAKGKIHLSALLEGEMVLFKVSDSGPGIPQADQEWIFEKFTRLKTAGSPRGLGLGLAYCRLAVQGHGGTIWVENLPGQGTRFVFTIPIVS